MASEFWPPFLGYQIKVTDSFVVAFTLILSVATVLLYCATRKLAVISGRQEESTRIIERAYVKMSHTDPGLTFRIGETTESYTVEVKIENCGKTPAMVTEARLHFMARDWEEPLPHTIDYSDSDAADRPSSAFLVPGDFFFIHRGSGSDKHGAIRKDSKRLILFGYVDYTDVFGQQHRAGYAREYRTVQGNNLFLIAAKGYNYDRPRKETDRQDQDIIEG